MKINALVKGMSLIEQGWLHEEGLIILNKVLSFGDAETSLFIAYNVDKDEYLAIRGDQFISLDNSIFNMPAMIDSSSLPEDGDFYVADGDYGNTLELMDEEYDEQFYYDEDFYDDEEYDEIVLYDLYGLMSKGWSEEAIDRLIKDLQSLEDERE